MKRVVLTLLFCTLSVLVACEKDGDVMPTNLQINKSTLSLFELSTETLTATITPENATITRVAWTSSAADVATVSTNGLVTAIKAGVTTITAISIADPTKRATCSLTVMARDAKVGDYFYSDNTYSTSLVSSKTCIGMIFEVNADKKSGKIMSVDHGLEQQWNAWAGDYGATSLDDGRANTDAIASFIAKNDSWTEFPVFDWCKNRGPRWYIPAKNELLSILCATCELQWIPSGVAAAGQIVAWPDGEPMPGFEKYKEARASFNARLLAAPGGQPFDQNPCFSSTELDTWRIFSVEFITGVMNNFSKASKGCNVRAISKF